MADVIDLNAKRDERRLLLVCNCGCTSMTLFANGLVECASCELELGRAADIPWRERVPPAPAVNAVVPDTNDCFRVVPLQSPKSALQRWAASEHITDVKALVLMHTDGGVSTSQFGDAFDTEVAKQWLARRFEQAFELLTRGPQPPQPTEKTMPESPIMPSIGRVVLVRSKDPTIVGNGGETTCGLVTHVHSQNCINVMVMRDGLAPAPQTSLSFDDSDEPAAHASWYWMPYQVQKAAEQPA